MDFGVHLGADVGEQAHPVPFPDVILPAVGHAYGHVVEHLSSDERGCGEPQCLIECTVCHIVTQEQSID